MKIYHSPTSPFVRKCLVTAHLLGLSDRIEHLPSDAHPIDRSQTIIASNPLGQVPTFFTDDGMVLFDSQVICEYLNDLAGGSLLPGGAQRWPVLTEMALADGILNAALLARYEAALRPEALRWDAWFNGQMDKIAKSLDWFEKNGGRARARVDLASISFACALGYLDFRFADFDWRAERPAAAAWYAEFNASPAMRATAPPA